MAVRSVEVGEGIALGQFLKYSGVAATGGHAKVLIEEGDVLVNGDVETRRGRKLRGGDVVVVGGDEILVVKRGAGGADERR